jgi:hypothetical protein
MRSLRPNAPAATAAVARTDDSTGIYLSHIDRYGTRSLHADAVQRLHPGRAAAERHVGAGAHGQADALAAFHRSTILLHRHLVGAQRQIGHAVAATLVNLHFATEAAAGVLHQHRLAGTVGHAADDAAVVDCACTLPMATTRAKAKACFWIVLFIRRSPRKIQKDLAGHPVYRPARKDTMCSGRGHAQ